jgi:hypothetical protein
VWERIGGERKRDGWVRDKFGEGRRKNNRSKV